MSAVYRGFSALVAAAAICIFSIPTSVTPAAARGEVVPFRGEASAGTIVVRTSERRLYLVLGEGRALSYPVGVGRAGRQWAGRSIISGKHIKPAWAPPPDIARARPGLARVHAGGAPSNPMGAAALTLSGGDYAIHGTNDPSSIGGFVSYGCIRMHNHDITDLYGRVSIGTPVLVTR
jgi:lipoprotein-anchoring transpeptidase ErfK/SrfK